MTATEKYQDGVQSLRRWKFPDFYQFSGGDVVENMENLKYNGDSTRSAAFGGGKRRYKPKVCENWNTGRGQTSDEIESPIFEKHIFTLFATLYS